MTTRDYHRPIYHFIPPSGWMNDPNGPITDADRMHHLFYQHNPDGGWHEQMHWGHARTRDLVHWEHLPIALYPDMPYDKDGIYSGSALELNGEPILFYTGIRPEVQCIALGSSDYSNWQKAPAPIVSGRPDGLKLDGFRDPTIWFDPNGSRLNMGIGSGISGGTGCVLRYSAEAASRTDWRFDGFLLRGHPALLVNCECPDYWQHDDANWVMIASPQADDPRRGAGTVWLTGVHVDGEFNPKRQGLLDASPLYYAPKSFWHIDGRRVVWGWMREARSVDKAAGREWAGVMSLPREVELDEAGTVRVRPSPEVQSLRGAPIAIGGERSDLYDGEGRVKTTIGATPAVEHCIELEPSASGSVALSLYEDEVAGESIVVSFNFATGELRLTLMFAWDDSEGKPVARTTVCGVNCDLPNVDGVFRLGDMEPLSLRVFLDHSVIEVFANDRAAMSGRYYPRRGNEPDRCADAYSGTAMAEGRRLGVTRWEAWNIPSVWD